VQLLKCLQGGGGRETTLRLQGQETEKAGMQSCINEYAILEKKMVGKNKCYPWPFLPFGIVTNKKYFVRKK